MTNDNRALAGAAQVEQLADSLSAAADALHGRIMDGLRRPPPAGAASSTAAPALRLSALEAQALFDNEVALRQQANSLYMAAASYAVTGLAVSQQNMLDLSEAARKKIARINKLQDLASIGADLLALAGALVAAKPQAIASALDAMRDHIKERKQEKAERDGPLT